MKTPLEHLEKRYSEIRYGSRPLVYQSSVGTDGTMYGSYKTIPIRDILDKRVYILEPFEGVSILYLDVLYDPRKYRHIYLM